MWNKAKIRIFFFFLLKHVSPMSFFFFSSLCCLFEVKLRGLIHHSSQLFACTIMFLILKSKIIKTPENWHVTMWVLSVISHLYFPTVKQPTRERKIKPWSFQGVGKVRKCLFFHMSQQKGIMDTMKCNKKVWQSFHQKIAADNGTGWREHMQINYTITCLSSKKLVGHVWLS